MIGAVLGNYRIIDALSSGGMGSVYRARHELLDRPAAIKLLRPELTANDELVQRFFNEAKAATAIRHPGIVEVYDFGYTDDGHAYLVMEFLEGQPLSRAVAERGRFPELEAASIARSIASALKAVHGKGIFHRDLKPDNVFLVPDPDGREVRVKVLDFGIAKLANPERSENTRRTQTGILMGTPKYMAPEQAREAGTIDHRADLYSLGCMLYELLVGRPPFLADGAGEIIAMQLFSEPEPPSKHIEISPEMEHLVMRLLAKEPSERCQNAVEVMDALVAIGARVSARLSAAKDAISVDSRNTIHVSASTRAQLDSHRHRVSQLDTIPAMSSAEIPVAKPRSSSSKLPFLVAGLALAVVAAVAAFFLTRKPPKPAAPEQPETTVRSPAPPVRPPQVQDVVAPPPTALVDVPIETSDTPPKVVKTKPGKPTKGGGGETKPAETKPTETKPAETKPAETKPAETKPTTENGSPFEKGDTLFEDPKPKP